MPAQTRLSSRGLFEGCVGGSEVGVEGGGLEGCVEGCVGVWDRAGGYSRVASEVGIERGVASRVASEVGVEGVEIDSKRFREEIKNDIRK